MNVFCCFRVRRFCRWKIRGILYIDLFTEWQMKFKRDLLGRGGEFSRTVESSCGIDIYRCRPTINCCKKGGAKSRPRVQRLSDESAKSCDIVFWYNKSNEVIVSPYIKDGNRTLLLKFGFDSFRISNKDQH